MHLYMFLCISYKYNYFIYYKYKSRINILLMLVLFPYQFMLVFFPSKIYFSETHFIKKKKFFSRIDINLNRNNTLRKHLFWTELHIH